MSKPKWRGTTIETRDRLAATGWTILDTEHRVRHGKGNLRDIGGFGDLLIARLGNGIWIVQACRATDHAAHVRALETSANATLWIAECGGTALVTWHKDKATKAWARATVLVRNKIDFGWYPPAKGEPGYEFHEPKEGEE